MLSVLLATWADRDLSSDTLERWRSKCIISNARAWSLTSYLHFDLSARHAMVDVIAFLPTEMIVDYALKAFMVIEDVRKLPEECCMRDGRKWKRVPCVVLSENTYMPYHFLLREAGVPIVRDSYKVHF